MHKPLNTSIVLLIVFFSCSTMDTELVRLETALANKISKPRYRLVSLQTHDTVTRVAFKKDLEEAIGKWNVTNREQFLEDFKAAYTHFSQVHVQHLHEQRLDIQDLSDSITLIHEHANSFVHEHAIKGLYLNQLSNMVATLSELDTLSTDIIWFTVDHSYQSETASSTSEERLFYFPAENSFLSYDPVLDHIGIYNLLKFQLKSR